MNNQYGIQAAHLRVSAAGEAASGMMDGMLTTRRSPISAPRKSTSAASNYSFVLALALVGLATSAVLAISLATDPVLLAWASPI